jgi:N-acetyl-gamma-glutamyl-phosphate reductase
MLSTIYVTTAFPEDKLKACLSDFYRCSTFVKLIDTLPSTKDVRGTNRCLMSVVKGKASRRATIISVIDNLTKGASGQAVQNMNLMFGLNEAAALDCVPVFP